MNEEMYDVPLYVDSEGDEPLLLAFAKWGAGLDYSSGFGWFGSGPHEAMYREADRKRIAEAEAFAAEHPDRAAEVEKAIATYRERVAPLYQTDAQ